MTDRMMATPEQATRALNLCCGGTLTATLTPGADGPICTLRGLDQTSNGGRLLIAAQLLLEMRGDAAAILPEPLTRQIDEAHHALMVALCHIGAALHSRRGDVVKQ